MLLYETDDKVTHSIFTTLQKYKPIPEWQDEDLDSFLYDSSLISVNTIEKYIHVVRKIYRYNCEKTGVKCQELNATKELYNYVDMERLRSKTIMSWEEFWAIRNELIHIDINNQPRNYRDVVLFELPWLGLTSKEIQNLKREDVTKSTENGQISLKLNLPTREVFIDNKEICDDIIRALKEDIYVKVKFYENRNIIFVEEGVPYETSPYLIRGISNGITIPNKPVNQAGRLLSKQLSKLVMPNLPIDLPHLSLEDIRRSRILHLLNQDASISEIKKMLNKKQDSDLFWLKPVARLLKEWEQKRLQKIKG